MTPTEATNRENQKPVKIVVVNAGVSDPSSTRMLAERAVAATTKRLGKLGRDAVVSYVDLAPMAVDIAQSLVAASPRPPVQEAIEQLATADAIVVSTPVYKAGVSGLFKSFVDLLDNDLIVAKPVLLAATAGTERHSMVIDEQMRPLFAFMRAIPVPTSVFAAPDDWADPALSKRLKRAGTELAALANANIEEVITGQSWGSYNHQFGGSAAKAREADAELDFDTDLMRLAAGGA